MVNSKDMKNETKRNDRNNNENNENWMHKNVVGPLYALNHDTPHVCVIQISNISRDQR